MKKIKSFLLIAFIMVFSTVTVAFAEDATFDYDSDTLKSDAESLYEQFTSLSDNDIEYIINNNANGYALGQGVKSYSSIKGSLGKFDSIAGTEIEEHGDYINVIVTGKFKDANAEMVVEYREVFQTATMTNISFSLVDNGKNGFGERMLDALLNTIMGLFTVFVVLILIAFLISRFVYISKIQNYFENRKNKKESKNDAVDNTIAQIVAKEEAENLVDDLELVAVISAAIAEYEGTSTDGFVVRSINRTRSNKWRNA